MRNKINLKQKFTDKNYNIYIMIYISAQNLAQIWLFERFLGRIWPKIERDDLAANHATFGR